MGAAAAPLMIAGMAASMAGAGVNFAQQRAQSKRADRIMQQSYDVARQNRAKATERWKEALEKVGPEGAEAALAEEAAKRQALYDERTANVAEQTNVIPDKSDTPRVVKTYAAKQLGDKLAEARAQMAAYANLGGWKDALSRAGMEINRSGQDVARYGNFTQGWTQAANMDAASTRAKKPTIPIGDLLQAGGSVAMAGSGSGFGGMIPAESWWLKPIEFGKTPAAGLAGGGTNMVMR